MPPRSHGPNRNNVHERLPASLFGGIQLFLCFWSLNVKAVCPAGSVRRLPVGRSALLFVRYEPSQLKARRAHLYGANYTVWIPGDLKTVRGVIVHQHGCGEGSCNRSSPEPMTSTGRPLRRRHNCLLMRPAYEQPEKADCQMWCDPQLVRAAAFQRALVDLGAKSGHPELAEVPWTAGVTAAEVTGRDEWSSRTHERCRGGLASLGARPPN